MAKKKRQVGIGGGPSLAYNAPSPDYDPMKWRAEDAARELIHNHPDTRDMVEHLGKAIHGTVRRVLYKGRPFIKKGKRGR